MRETKVQIIKKLEELKQDIDDRFAKNSTDVLEAKLIDRMNDIVKCLTRETADREDTKKNFKLVDRQIRNVFRIAVHTMKNIQIVS